MGREGTHLSGISPSARRWGGHVSGFRTQDTPLQFWVGVIVPNPTQSTQATGPATEKCAWSSRSQLLSPHPRAGPAGEWDTRPSGVGTFLLGPPAPGHCLLCCYPVPGLLGLRLSADFPLGSESPSEMTRLQRRQGGADPSLPGSQRLCQGPPREDLPSGRVQHRLLRVRPLLWCFQGCVPWGGVGVGTEVGQESSVFSAVPHSQRAAWDLVQLSL